MYGLEIQLVRQGRTVLYISDWNKSLLEQWSLTGGRLSSLAMSVFFIVSASLIWKPKRGKHFTNQEINLIQPCNERKKQQCGGNDCWIEKLKTEQQNSNTGSRGIVMDAECSLTDLPFTHSVTRELEAMAEPQPNVLNLASTIFPWSSTSICR